MAASLILPDLRLSSRANKTWRESGIDSLAKCLDKKHFLSYPYPIEYRYNDRGFRDAQWSDQIAESIWCVGDSFTVGVGQPFDHIWPQVLARTIGKNAVNVSMDGASNDWIARRALEIVKSVKPRHVVVMWSYVERREVFQQAIADAAWRAIYQAVRGHDWPNCEHVQDALSLPVAIQHELEHLHQIWLPVIFDDLMSQQAADATVDQHFANWQQCVQMLAPHASVIHTTVPRFAPKDHERFWQYLVHTTDRWVKPYQQIDWARDGHHFDILTARQLVDHLARMIH